MGDAHAVCGHLVQGGLERLQKFIEILLVDFADGYMVQVLWNDLRVKFQGVGDLDGIGSVGPEKQLRVVEIVKIIDRVAGAELDSLDLLEIEKEDFLLQRRLSAETDPVERFF